MTRIVANWLIKSTVQFFTCTSFHPSRKKSPKCAKVSANFTRKIIYAKINMIMNNNASASKFAANQTVTKIDHN